MPKAIEVIDSPRHTTVIMGLDDEEVAAYERRTTTPPPELEAKFTLQEYRPGPAPFDAPTWEELDPRHIRSAELNMRPGSAGLLAPEWVCIALNNIVTDIGLPFCATHIGLFEVDDSHTLMALRGVDEEADLAIYCYISLRAFTRHTDPETADVICNALAFGSRPTL
jgi:hypothetical protein